MKQLERIYMLPKNNFNTNSRSQKGVKFAYKIDKIAIIIRHFTRAPWRTDAHSDALYKAV